MKTSSAFRSLLLTSAAVVALGTVAACGSTDDGPSVQERNRALVVDFYDAFFNKHDVTAADAIADDYKQHNPLVPNGKAAFVSYFTGYFKDNPESTNRIVRSAGADDLVYLHVHSQVRPGDRGDAIVDIFRVADGRIVEHWDVIQPVPAETANGNTMF